MNHLDEGTIHAWLDGALNTAQSVEIEAHVKSCAECSAKVAEARGLIAASSHILLSLDDTPANVIPKKAAVPPRRRWTAAPWIRGLAAAAIIVLLWNNSDVERPKPAADIKVPEVRVVSGLPEPSLERLKEPTPPPAAIPPVVAEQPRARVANRPRNLASGSGTVAGAAGARTADVASAQVAAAPVAPEPTSAMRDETQRREAFASEALRRARTDSGSSSNAALAGCYRIQPLPKVRLEEVVATSVAESRAPEKVQTRRAAAAAPAPTAIQKAADVDVRDDLVVRLDAPGWVRAIGSDSIIGSWDRFIADSVRVHFRGRTPYVSSLNKVQCP